MTNSFKPSSLSNEVERSTFGAFSPQQVKLKVDQSQEMNDCVNRHQFLWICHYRKHLCKPTSKNSTSDEPKTKALAQVFKDSARLRFRGIQYLLLTQDLSNATQILVHTDDLVMEETNLSLAETTQKLVQWEAKKTAILLTEIFQVPLFRKFYVASVGKNEEKLMEEKMTYALKAPWFAVLRFLQYLDHMVNYSTY